MFENLKQKIKHEIKNRQEAREAYRAAQKEEGLRLQHISAQKKLELKKQRIEKAKSDGVKSKHRLESIKIKAAQIKQDPFLKQLVSRAKQEAMKSIVGRPHRKRKKARKSRKRGY